MHRSNAVRIGVENIDGQSDVSTAGGIGSAARSEFPQFHRALTAATEPTWQKEVLARVTALLRLRPGWDSYKAPAPRYDAAMFALTVLQGIMRPGTPAPSVVPSSTGGIQLEWHEKHIDLEIHVLGPYKGEVWWLDHTTGDEVSGGLQADLSILQAPIGKMSA